MVALLTVTGSEMIGDADAGRSLLARATKNCRLENSLNALEDTLCRFGLLKPNWLEDFEHVSGRNLRHRDIPESTGIHTLPSCSATA